MPIELSSVCGFCGKEAWQHVQRRSARGIDILPCLEMAKDLLKSDFKKRADKDGNCKLCGKPLMNHWEYERMRINALGTDIVPKGVSILFPCKEIECGMVPKEEPVSNDIPLKPE